MLGLICCLWMTGVQGQDAPRLKVVTTIFPFHDMVRAVGGERVEARLLLPTGVEPHAYEPSPADIARIDGADMFVFAGSAMEPWVAALLPGLTRESLFIFDASEDLVVVDGDPHVWLDPGMDQVIVQRLADELGDLDPDHRAYYAQNAAAYKAELDALDARIREGLKDCARRTFIYGGHSAFGYFARRYGLIQQTPYRGYASDEEPSIRDMARLADQAAASGAKVVFFEELVEPRVAHAIARETGARPELLSGAHNITRVQLGSGTTLIMIMDENLRKLREALECR